MEVHTGLRTNACNPGNMIWIVKQFDGIKASDDASVDFLEREETDKLRMSDLNEQLRNVKDVSLKEANTIIRL